MYLSAVEIKNFRSIKELRVEFQSGLNVIVGRNNVGKTNLLRAIRIALGPSASRGDTVWLDPDDFYKESASDDTERTISITLIFEGLTEAQRAHFYEIVDFNLRDLAKSKAIIRFEASWPKGRRHPTVKRTGGPSSSNSPEVPNSLLESIPVTFLPALRDAEVALAPGYKSRVALLLRDLDKRIDGNAESQIVDIYKKANAELENVGLVNDTKKSLQETTKKLAGNDYFPLSIRAAEADFMRILRSLQIQMENVPIGGLDANGLGYNNLLYMAVVLEHLKNPEPDECPLLLIEEPEAHLHPQLTTLLADYLANNTPGKNQPQTIVTTHSATLAASVPPNRVLVLFEDHISKRLLCNDIAKAEMDEFELNELQRMMDITRATMYFAKGIILVEGVSEALLIPVLARRINLDLAKLHISVIPICGVSFGTFRKLLQPTVLGIPVAIVTDADPPQTTDKWQEAMPETENGAYKVSERTKSLINSFKDHPTVKVFPSKVTLEYDLAEAGDENAMLMAEAWEQCFIGTPGTFNKQMVKEAGSERKAKALAAWRGICLAKHSGSKAELAQRLSRLLDQRNKEGAFEHVFKVPEYLENAIRYVVEKIVSSKFSEEFE